MKFRDGDDVIGRYLKARKRASSPRGMAVAQRGRSYGAECPNRKCRHRGKPIDQRDGQVERWKRIETKARFLVDQLYQNPPHGWILGKGSSIYDLSEALR